MKTAKRKPTAIKLRSWHVIIMPSRGEYLGSVEAPDRERELRLWPSSSLTWGDPLLIEVIWALEFARPRTH
jgi:hypothetical protein